MGQEKEKGQVKCNFRTVRVSNLSLIPCYAPERKSCSEATHLSHPGLCNQGPEFRVVLSIRPEVSGDMVHLFSPVS